MRTLPNLAVIMPVLNEENHILSAVNAILTQEYAGRLKLVLALGPSTDRTNEVVAEIQKLDPRILVVPNPSGRTPDALNAAIAATDESIIARVDAHSELSEGYLANAVETLLRTGADNVGGIMAAEGKTLFERAVATAMTSKLGVGAAAFHVGGNEGPADTVYLGVFLRSALERVGGYDPSFTRAQDWEMNYRIRKSGGKVWFTPTLKVTYRPRSTVRALAKQYFQYGQWRRKVMREHPDTVKTFSAFRYFAPPLAVTLISLGLVIAVVGFACATSHLTFWGLLPLTTYLISILAASLFLARKSGKAALYLPLALPVMHFSWGIGFLKSTKN
ncbi:MAG: glycosyltransferase family 2 protein [Actinobacteria bacterium]|nr:glycosyltransferase family 2 protein [Actinomycetota bacterium]NBY15404.1 glycosyltransferase family 2 protein [Actinomycetota bacterium]